MLTTKQKPILDTHKIKRKKQSISLQKIINSQRKIVWKKRNRGTTKRPEIHKMAIISPYLSIIILNVNGLNFPIKGHTVAEWKKKKTRLYAAYKRFTSASRTHIGGIPWQSSG